MTSSQRDRALLVWHVVRRIDPSPRTPLIPGDNLSQGRVGGIFGFPHSVGGSEAAAFCETLICNVRNEVPVKYEFFVFMALYAAPLSAAAGTHRQKKIV